MKQCFSLHKMCELYHICCFIRQYHIEEKWAIYHPGEYIFVSGAGASAPRRRGHVRREQVNTRPMQGMRRVSRFTGKWKRYLSGVAKNNVVASDYE
ncbi:hypothetical protein EGK38_001000 [Enterobacter hormaechei]|nr:hypothetical protein EGK38_001000 [Enterobacter hormaechei]